jgi:hypothetical protein
MFMVDTWFFCLYIKGFIKSSLIFPVPGLNFDLIAFYSIVCLCDVVGNMLAIGRKVETWPRWVDF